MYKSKMIFMNKLWEVLDLMKLYFNVRVNKNTTRLFHKETANLKITLNY